MSKHTKGPWHIVWEEETDSWNRAVDAYIRGIEDNEGNYIFTFDDDFANLEANARLIAAASELLEAATAVVQTWEGPFKVSGMESAEHGAPMKQLMVAIAKAEEA